MILKAKHIGNLGHTTPSLMSTPTTSGEQSQSDTGSVYILAVYSDSTVRRRSGVLVRVNHTRTPRVLFRLDGRADVDLRVRVVKKGGTHCGRV